MIKIRRCDRRLAELSPTIYIYQEFLCMSYSTYCCLVRNITISFCSFFHCSTKTNVERSQVARKRRSCECKMIKCKQNDRRARTKKTRHFVCYYICILLLFNGVLRYAWYFPLYVGMNELEHLIILCVKRYFAWLRQISENNKMKISNFHCVSH